MKVITNLLVTMVLSILVCSVQAQIVVPSASPTAKLEQEVGLTKITVEYSRPSLKDRVVLGTATEKSIEKYGQAWRTGANTATKFTFSDDVKIAGQDLKKGAYSILTIPEAKTWTIKFFTYESGSWTAYLEKTPVLETKVDVQNTGRAVETFTIDINNINMASATIDLLWGNFLVSIPMTVEVDTHVSKAIETTLAGPSQNDYYQAASYFHDAGKDLSQALVWIKQANAKEPKFWMVRKEALILADMGNYQAAIKAATQSKELAQAAKYEPYIRMNEESIAEWTKKVGKTGKVQVEAQKMEVPKTKAPEQKQDKI